MRATCSVAGSTALQRRSATTLWPSSHTHAGADFSAVHGTGGLTELETGLTKLRGHARESPRRALSDWLLDLLDALTRPRK